MFDKKSKLIIMVGIIAFLAMSFSGLYSMPMDEHGEMRDCPFMKNSAYLCQMSVIEHIVHWRQLFILIMDNNFSLLFFVFFFFPVLLSFMNSKVRDKLFSQRFYKSFCRDKPEIKLFNYLLIAFSQGILHPRVYA